MFNKKKENSKTMNIDAKFLNTNLDTNFKYVYKGSLSMIKLASFQGCRDGSAYINQ